MDVRAKRIDCDAAKWLKQDAMKRFAYLIRMNEDEFVKIVRGKGWAKVLGDHH